MVLSLHSSLRSESIKVYRFLESSESSSGFKGYRASVLNIFCFIKRISPQEALKLNLFNLGKDVKETAYVSSYQQLFSTKESQYADTIKWNGEYLSLIHI